MMNAAAFAKMKTGVRIVNCARGELVDEGELHAAMASRQGGWRGARCVSEGAARESSRCSSWSR